MIHCAVSQVIWITFFLLIARITFKQLKKNERKIEKGKRDNLLVVMQVCGGNVTTR